MRNELADSSIFRDGALPAVLIDRQGTIVAQNQACQHVFGAEMEALSIDVFDARDRDTVASLLAEVLTGQRRTASLDGRLRLPDGSEIGARLWAAPVVDADGVITHVMGSVADITDHLDALDRLERTSAAHAQFASSVSHEIRTPLHAIMGLAELLAASDLGERDQKLAGAIVTEAAALRAVIDDTLDMSRIDAGTVEISGDLFSPAECAAGAVRLLRQRAIDKGLELTVRVDPTVPAVVRGDEHRVRQVLVNLLNNAVKFTLDGSVSLTVTPGDDDLLAFEVRDTGPGIPQAEQASVYDPFVRLHSDSADGGAGLGLAISARLIAAMGGTIVMHSEVGRGTTFTFDVPLPSSSAGITPAESTTVGGAAAHAPLVLIVEDSEVNQLLVTSQLDRLEHRYLLAGSAPEAFALLAEHGSDIDVVLMDWHLPGMDGLDATRSIRATEEAAGRPRIPVVAVTARAMAGDRQLCLDAGMDDFLAKPVSLDRLRETLATWVGGADGSMAATPDASRLGVGASVDRGVLATLVGELGDVSVVRSLIDTFLAELPGRIAVIASQPDPRRAAHTLKSTAAMLGATALAEWCFAVERGDPAPVAPSARSELELLARSTVAELTSTRNQLEAA